MPRKLLPGRLPKIKRRQLKKPLRLLQKLPLMLSIRLKSKDFKLSKKRMI